MRLLLTPVLALSLGFLAARAADPPPAVPGSPVPAHFENCAKVCDDCARVCNICAVHCAKLVADGKKEHMHTLTHCQDCATFCSAASCITAKAGPFSDLICASCADACKRCGDACEKHKDDPVMKRCMEECRRCEAVCRDMLKQIGPRGNAAR